MKLRNKKTGEIGYLYEHSLMQDIIIVYDVKGIVGKYNSLAELNEEWEDAPEEPKYFYCICTEGSINKYEVERYETETWVKHAKSIGNYFDTREEAEKAVEKLKAWKRLKDNGFKFEGTYYLGKPFNSYDECEQAMKDLAILIGGEE